MLYLEDFLEIVEQLPSELRDRSTEMRMLDLQVQSGLDQVNKSVKDFMQQAPNLTAEQRQTRYKQIRDEYQKIRDQAEEKVSIADAMYSLVEKYHNRLNREVLHFKYELEADSPGITEVIERKLNDAERASLASRRERKRKARQMEEMRAAAGADSGDLLENQSESSTEQIQAMAQALGQNAANSFNNAAHKGQAPLDPTIQPPPLKLPMKRAETYPKNLGDSRKASSICALNVKPFETSGLPSTAHNTPIVSSTLNTVTGQQPNLPSFLDPESRHGRHRKLTSRAQEMLKESLTKQERSRPRFSAGDSEEEEDDDADDFGNDDAKRTWCICNTKSYGDMVACDNKSCPFEWFHYTCVGISAPPKGKWYCPHCKESQLRKGIPFDATI